MVQNDLSEESVQIFFVIFVEAWFFIVFLKNDFDVELKFG